VLGQLDDLEELRPLDEAQVKSLSREDRRFILKQALVMAYADKKKSPQEASYLEILSKKLELPQELFEDIEREVRAEQGL
jgi:uncharacterized membrane protein YebE (DUF533 family)